MFWSVYQELKRQFPQVKFNLHCRPGQELFNDISTDTYDLLFQVPMIERAGKSKSSICAEEELGIVWNPKLEFTYKIPDVPMSDIPIPENAIGLAFQSVSNPRKRLSEDKAHLIWDCVREAGFSPIEIQFEHIYKKAENTRYPFTDLTCRDFTPSVENCIAAVRKCRAFIGVSTGPICIAVSLYPERTMHLSTCDTWSPKFQAISRISELNCRDNIDIVSLQAFLEKCK